MIKLNIYATQSGRKDNTIEKTYTAESYNLMFGTVQDLLEVFEPENMGDEKAIGVAILKSFNRVEPILLDVFPGLTSEELKRTNTAELITAFLEIGKAAIESLGLLPKSKN